MCAGCFGVSCSEDIPNPPVSPAPCQRGWTADDLQRSLPTPTIVGFCFQALCTFQLHQHRMRWEGTPGAHLVQAPSPTNSELSRIPGERWKGISVDHPAQPPWPGRVSWNVPGGCGISPDRETPRPPWAAAPGLRQPPGKKFFLISRWNLWCFSFWPLLLILSQTEQSLAPSSDTPWRFL